MFVRGNLSFNLDSTSIKFENKKITPSGVEGLPWPPLDPKKHYGKTVSVTVVISSPSPSTFTVNARITRESTALSNTMGLLFQFDEKQRSEFIDFTERFGQTPVTYTRRFPRIPSYHLIQTYPVKVFTEIQGNKVEFEVEDLSPEGIMIFSQQGAVFGLKIKDELTLRIEAKPQFPQTAQIRGSIRRILDDIDLETGTEIHHLGIQFTAFGPEDKKILMTLLKDILLKIKSQMKPGAPPEA